MSPCSRSSSAGRSPLRALTGAAVVAALLSGAAALPAAAAEVAVQAPAGAGEELSPGSMLPAGSPDARPQAAASLTSTTDAAGPAAASSYVGITGPDVSRYQHGAAISWSSVASHGSRFAVVKATEGTGYTNPYYAGDVAGARAAGLVVGAYHFARPEASATAQADAFAARLGTGVASMLPPVLDLETSGGLSPAALQAWAHAFLDRLQARTGRLPMIYTGPSFWAASMAGSTAFTRYPLWVAHYGASSPTLPGGWRSWTFWQYTSSASVPGISGAVDGNRFNGSLSALQALAHQAAQVTSPVPAVDRSPVLKAGGVLTTGKSLVSSTGQYRLVVQGDGNVVTYGNGRALWSAGTAGHPGSRLVVQGDGNLVVYSSGGSALWNTGTWGRTSPGLQMQDDGDLELTGSGRTAWHTGSGGAAVLSPGAWLSAGQHLHSVDGRSVLIVQGDGNVVLYLAGRAAWSSRTNGRTGARLVLQGDGNLVVYSAAGAPLWNAGTSGAGAAQLVVQADGNLVEYAGGAARWWTATHV